MRYLMYLLAILTAPYFYSLIVLFGAKNYTLKDYLIENYVFYQSGESYGIFD